MPYDEIPSARELIKEKWVSLRWVSGERLLGKLQEHLGRSSGYYMLGLSENVKTHLDENHHLVCGVVLHEVKHLDQLLVAVISGELDKDNYLSDERIAEFEKDETQEVKVTLVSIECTAVSDDDTGPIDIDQIQIGLNAYDMNLNTQPELIKLANEQEAQIDGTNFTRLYFRESLDNPFWRTDSGGKYDVNRTLYIQFNTDPDNYDFELSNINFRGYVHDDDVWVSEPGEGYVENKTITLRDSIGEHTFTIRGSEFSLDVKIKIELVD